MPKLWKRKAKPKMLGDDEDEHVPEEPHGKIEVAAQAYIQSSLLTIVNKLLVDLESEQEQIRFIDLSQRLHTLYSMRFARQTENLRSCFERFCAETPPTLEVHFGGDALANTPIALQDDEDFFVETLHRTLSEGNFDLLSNDYYESACATDFEVGIEMKMDDRALDTSFIKRLHDRHKREPIFRKSASVTRKVLIYNRGMGQATTKGFFILTKIDIILEWTFFAVFGICWGILSKILSIVNVFAHAKRMKAKMKKKKKKDIHDEENDDDNSGADSSEELDTDEEQEDNDEGPKRYVYRYTLKQAIRENWMNLFTTVELREPTFRELIIVYRTNQNIKEAERDQRIPRIVLKSFTDIPIADFEVVLPAQKPVSRPMDALKIIIAALAAVYAVHNKLLDTREKFAGQTEVELVDVLGAIWPTLAVVGGYVVKIVMQYLAAQKKYSSIITSYLYGKSLCSNRGLLPFIVDSTLQQEVKEALIGYYFLWTNRAQTFAELDEESEIFLSSLEEEVDFEAEDAIRKLMLDDLVRCAMPRTKNSQLFHLSISRVVKSLQDKITAFHEDKERECPYCPYLHPEESHALLHGT